MQDEQSDLIEPAQVIENDDAAETPPVEVEGLRVYERPARPVIPAWAWLLILLVVALLVWLAIQAL